MVGGQGDSISRLMMRIVGVLIWVMVIINLLTTSP